MVTTISSQAGDPGLPDSIFSWRFEATSGDSWGGTFVADSALYEAGQAIAGAAGTYVVVAEEAYSTDLSASDLEDGSVFVEWYFDGQSARFLPTRTGAGTPAGLAGLGSELDQAWTGLAWASFGEGGRLQANLAVAMADAVFTWIFEANSGDRWGGLLYGVATDYAVGDTVQAAAGRYRILAEAAPDPGLQAPAGSVLLTGRYADSRSGTELAIRDADGLTVHGTGGLGSETGEALAASGWASFGLAGGAQVDSAPGVWIFPVALVASSLSFSSSSSRVLLSDGRELRGPGLELRFNDGVISNRHGDLLFDSIYYDTNYRDVFRAGIDERQHYALYGRFEGRDPSAFFSTNGYLSANPDVRAAGLNPLEHFRNYGWHEGRDPAWFFDTRLYLTYNPDVAAAGMDPLAHYLGFGAAEERRTGEVVGRTVSAGFDTDYYLLRNPDVGFAGMNAEVHYRLFGFREGRNPNSWFDARGYLSAYPDVAAAGVDPLAHYMTWGWREGRDPTARFDTTSYLAANPDVAAAGMNPLEHFLLNGNIEKRSPQGEGMWG